MKHEWMTYGELPSEEAFEDMWMREMGDDHEYSIRNCDRVGNQSYATAAELYADLTRARDDWAAGDEEAGDWASAVLSTLGVLWV